jgi:hypothetical protein
VGRFQPGQLWLITWSYLFFASMMAPSAPSYSADPLPHQGLVDELFKQPLFIAAYPYDRKYLRSSENSANAWHGRQDAS